MSKDVKQRDQYVAKSNRLIRQSRFALGTQASKILLYMISKVRPDDTEYTEYEFTIKDFCKTCGIDDSQSFYKSGYEHKFTAKNGKEYIVRTTSLNDALKQFADYSVWIKNEDGEEELHRWLNTVKVDRDTGKIRVKFHESMQPYLFELRENYTQYKLENVLTFRSSYSIRLYELMKSYEYLEDIIEIPVDDLKRQLDAPDYSYSDLRKNVLDRAIREINSKATDIRITYAPIKSATDARKIISIAFEISQQKLWDQTKHRMDRNRALAKY